MSARQRPKLAILHGRKCAVQLRDRQGCFAEDALSRLTQFVLLHPAIQGVLVELKLRDGHFETFAHQAERNKPLHRKWIKRPQDGQLAQILDNMLDQNIEACTKRLPPHFDQPGQHVGVDQVNTLDED